METVAPPRPEYEVFYQEMVELLRRHEATLTPPELLAIASNMVGKLMAMQDQRTMSRTRAIKIVQKNIEVGNAQVIDALRRAKGGRA